MSQQPPNYLNQNAMLYNSIIKADVIELFVNQTNDDFLIKHVS